MKQTFYFKGSLWMGLISALVIALIFQHPKALEAENNLVVNPSFESVNDPTGDWDAKSAENWQVWKPTGNPLVTVSNEVAYEGENSLHIAAEETGRAAVSQDISITGGETYKFSSWIKTEDVTSQQGARLRAVYYSGDTQIDLIYSNSVKATEDWTYIELVLTPPEDVDRIRVQHFLESGTGTAWFDQTSLERFKPLESIDFSEEEFTISHQDSAEISHTITPEDATNTNIEWTSYNKDVATVENGIVYGNDIGETTILAKSADGSTFDTVKVKVVKNDTIDYPVLDSLSLSAENTSLQAGQKQLIDVSQSPGKSLPAELEWESSDDSIAKVENGIVTALSAGDVTITATANSDVAAEISFTINASTEDEFDILRQRWEEKILGNEAYNPDNEVMKDVVESKADRGQELWDTMNTNPENDFLWADLASTTNPADIRESYRQLDYMTEAFVMEDSELYHNKQLLEDIMYGLEWLYENRYNESIEQYGNWWPWEIGIPKNLNNIAVLLYDYLGPDTTNKYLEVSKHFQPDPTKSGATTPDRYREAFGANRIDTSLIVAVRGITMKDGDQIANSRDALSQVFEYVTEENGFYKDGSFVQHENIAYNGSYGIVLIEGLVDILELLADSSWDVTDEKVENVYDWIYDGFEPFMYKGSLMDMTRGRAISRSFLQDHQAGHTVINTVIRMAQFVPEPHAENFKRMAKYWIEQDTELDYIGNLSDFNSIQLANELMNDETITPRGELLLHKHYANMDRTVHRKPGYAFGISMYSSRIQNYEDMNNENRKGWFTGEGMTYLYNADLGQFSDGFWPTVDPYRMPGTTVDTQKRTDGSGEDVSKESWVGGSELLKQYGSTGMAYDAWNSSLTAKKSWFMFDNEIVALGAGITSEDDRNIETIVENRKISIDGSNKLSINGEAQSDALGWEESKKGVNWAFLEGNDTGSNIGYYFPESTDLQVKKEKRQGAWSDINYTEPDEVIERSYATMWVDHGKNPANENYAYVLLPNQTEDNVRQYAENPHISVLRNDDAVQAVEDKEAGILGANFWTDEKQTVDSLTVDSKASVTMKETDGIIDLAVADPTMENDGYITVNLSEKAFEILEKDDQIEVVKTKPHVQLRINVTGSRGQSFHIKLQTDPKQANSDQKDHFSIKAANGKQTLIGGAPFNTAITVENLKNNSENPNISVAYYNWKGELEGITTVQHDFHGEESHSIDVSLDIPENVDGGTVKAFAWRGKEIDHPSFKLFSDLETLSK